MAEEIYTLEEYCKLEKVSRSRVYQEWACGEGVEYFKRGNKLLISESARLAHREKLAEISRQARKARQNDAVKGAA